MERFSQVFKIVATIIILLIGISPCHAETDRQTINGYSLMAELGDAEAQFRMGLLYGSGEGVTKDEQQAVVWFRKAAEQGHANAQNALGFMYAKGRGISRDDRQAVLWYRKAAEQGHVGGQYNLGVMYAKGRGVSRDDRQAVAWLRKAAEQGHPEARKELQQVSAQQTREQNPNEDRDAFREKVPQRQGVSGWYRVVRSTRLLQDSDRNTEEITRLEPGKKVYVTESRGTYLRVESRQGREPGYISSSDVVPMKRY